MIFCVSRGESLALQRVENGAASWNGEWRMRMGVADARVLSFRV